MRMSTRPILILALACAGALTGFKATTAAEQAGGTRERTLFVSAVDKDGEPVSGLEPDAFVVREDGVRREVLRVSRATEPIDIALLVDNSAAARDDITFLREGLSKFVAKMATGNNIAVVALADRPTILVDYTNDTKRLSDAVGRLFSMSQSGMTLLDAIIETSQGLGRRETPRAVIVPVITDGIEFTNRYSDRRGLRARARGRRAALRRDRSVRLLRRARHPRALVSPEQWPREERRPADHPAQSTWP